MRIKEFPDDTHPWRIDMLGEIVRDMGMESEPKVTVHVTRLVEDFSNPLSNNALFYTDEAESKVLQQEQFLVGIGQFAELVHGSVWKDRSPQILAESQDIRTCELDTQNSEKTVLKSPFELGGHKFWINQQHLPLGAHFEDLKLANLQVFKTQEFNKKPMAVIIPHTEILRFYYFFSSKLFNLMFFGKLHEAINPEKSAVYDDGSVKVHLRYNFDDNEGWFLARWLSSPVMRAQTEAFRRRLVASELSTPESKCHVNIGFPFEGITNLSFRGKKVLLKPTPGSKLKGQFWGIFVTEIVECSHPFGFTEVYLDRDNNSLRGPNWEDEDLKPAFPNAASKDISHRKNETGVTSKTPANRDLQQAQASSFKSRFSDLMDRKFIKPDSKEYQKYKSLTTFEAGKKIAEEYSTSEAITLDTQTGSLDYKIKPEKRRAAAFDLEMFKPVLKELELLLPEGKITRLSLGTDDASEIGSGIYTFPRRIGRMRSWHFINGPDHRRQAIIAEVSFGERIVYVLELQRKEGKKSTDAFSTLILHNSSKTKVSEQELYMFMITTAEENGWPPGNLMRHLNRHAVSHNEGEEPRAFAQRLLEKLKIV